LDYIHFGEYYHTFHTLHNQLRLHNASDTKSYAQECFISSNVSSDISLILLFLINLSNVSASSEALAITGTSRAVESISLDALSSHSVVNIYLQSLFFLKFHFSAHSYQLSLRYFKSFSVNHSSNALENQFCLNGLNVSSFSS
jgi:hypothetical protein